MTRSRRHRFLAVAVIAVLIAGGGAVLFIERSSPFAVDQAVDRYRQSATTAPATMADGTSADGTSGADDDDVEPSAAAGQTPPAAAGGSVTAAGASAPAAGTAPGGSAPETRPIPPAGVYVYSTSGFEELHLFGGRRHDYPEESTVSVVHDGCGARARWQPLQQRWNESMYCPATQPGTLELKEYRTQREFMGVTKRVDMTCDPGSVAYVLSAEPRTWSGRCVGDHDELAFDGEAIADEVVDVGGERVQARHVELHFRLSGSSRGTGTQSLWLHPDTGLLLRFHSTMDLEVDTPVGASRYVEEYQLELTSLLPRR